MANPTSCPLYEKIPHKNTIQRAMDLIVLFLLLSLLLYRIISFNKYGHSTWILAFLCESWFTFIWVLITTIKWNPVDYKTYPERLLQRGLDQLPLVDMFVTTADPVMEPPIITINTVLSLLAVDYPANKLACYVSDDGCSPATFYSLVEASKFARLWVPFCKKYGVQVRVPFRYFISEPMWSSENSLEFQQEWKKMKNEYGQLSRKIEEAAQQSTPCDLTGEFAVFSNIERGNHPSIIKIVWEKKEGFSDGLPHIVYISREKRPQHSHHYKAGGMNVLTRISGLMTNAPFMLNVDCDMYANNPQIVLHAMCLHLGVKNEKECGFVQSPQFFYDGVKDDPFGNQMIVPQTILKRGQSGLQGPFYGGTGCFHRRKIIYGLLPDNTEIKGKSVDEGLQKRFGNSMEFTKTVERTLSGLNEKTGGPHNISSSIEAAYQVASCDYEYGSSWGKKVGWIYGSATEDVLTGMKIHAKGWTSVNCTPDPPAFLGCAPSAGPIVMTQRKRWATGLLEVLFSKNSPLFAYLTGKLQLGQCFAYMRVFTWGLRCIPELCYAVLPAYCIIANTNFLPKVQESALLIPVSLFVIYHIYTLVEYLQHGSSVRAWWNNQKMARINSTSACLFGFLSVIPKLLGLSETVFEVTRKDQSSRDDDDANDAGSFTFDDSAVFIPCTTLVLTYLAALFMALFGFQPPPHGGYGSGVGEILSCVWALLMFLPFVKGLFRRGKYGIPATTICKSAALAFIFVHLCTRTSFG